MPRALLDWTATWGAWGSLPQDAWQSPAVCQSHTDGTRAGAWLLPSVALSSLWGPVGLGVLGTAPMGATIPLRLCCQGVGASSNGCEVTGAALYVPHPVRDMGKSHQGDAGCVLMGAAFSAENMCCRSCAPLPGQGATDAAPLLGHTGKCNSPCTCGPPVPMSLRAGVSSHTITLCTIHVGMVPRPLGFVPSLRWGTAHPVKPTSWEPAGWGGNNAIPNANSTPQPRVPAPGAAQMVVGKDPPMKLRGGQLVPRPHSAP